MLHSQGTNRAPAPRPLALEFGRLAERIAPPLGSSHILHVYRDEQEYVRTVGRFLAAGLARGHPALAITTAPHRDAILAVLASLGCQPLCAQRELRLVFVDADTILSAICADGAPDPERFHRVIGAALHDAEACGARAAPFVHGEMIDLLCDAGDVDAACSLEGLWNELSAHRRFHLLCTCSARAFGGSAPRALHDRICSQHTHMLSSSAMHEVDGAVRVRSPSRRERDVFDREVELPNLRRAAD